MSFLRTWEEQLAHEKAVRDASRKAWLEALVSECRTLDEMAVLGGIAKGTLHRLADELGVSLPTIQGNKRQAYAACAAEGLTYSQTAKRLGVTYHTVVWAAKRYRLSFKKAQRKAREPEQPAAQRPAAPVLSPQDSMIERMKAKAAEENKAMRRRSGDSR